MRTAYLTIDDSPTGDTDRLTDFLAGRGIPAVLFCIGSSYSDLEIPCSGMDEDPGPIERAIGKGFVIGNHLHTHRRSSAIPYEEVVREIESTERLIDGLYKKAGRARPAKLLRFPHIDRGAGGWIVDYDAAGACGPALKSLFADGLNITLAPPSPEQMEKKARIQDYLKREGFTSDVYPGITHPWYTGTEMAAARDSLYTFSTSDWMLNPDFAAHAHQWPYRTLDALKGKIDADPWLNSPDGSANIVLAHDHNRLFDVTTALVAHIQARGAAFAPVAV